MARQRPPRETATQEMRVRRWAGRRGYRLVKSRRRDPLTADYGLYWLLPAGDTRPNTVRAGLDPAKGMTLDQVEARLASGGR